MEVVFIVTTVFTAAMLVFLHWRRTNTFQGIPTTPRLVSFAVYFWNILQLTKYEKSSVLASGYPWLRIFISDCLCRHVARVFETKNSKSQKHFATCNTV